MTKISILVKSDLERQILEAKDIDEQRLSGTHMDLLARSLYSDKTVIRFWNGSIRRRLKVVKTADNQVGRAVNNSTFSSSDGHNSGVKSGSQKTML